MIRPTALLLPALLLVLPARAAQPGLNPNFPAAVAPASASGAAVDPTGLSQPDQVTLLLSQAFQLAQDKQADAAMAKVNQALQIQPRNATAYGLLGSIYASKKLWPQAEKNFQTSIELDEKNVQVKFNLAEVEFVQKKYDTARPLFLDLAKDPDIGDLADYKVFLCDLFGGHREAAAQELNVFNEAGRNASYYFANAAWLLYQHKIEDARGWLTSASTIYAPTKFKLYAASLIVLGYLPLPPPSA